MAVLAVSAVVAVLAWQGMVRRAETGRARSIHDRSVTPRDRRVTVSRNSDSFLTSFPEAEIWFFAGSKLVA